MDDKEIWGFNESEEPTEAIVEEDLAYVTEQGTKRVRRRQAATGATVLVILALVTGLALSMQSDPKENNTAHKGSTTTSTKVASSTTTIQKLANPAADRPKDLVATDGTTIFLLDSQTGERIRDLATAPVATDPQDERSRVASITLNKQQRTAYYKVNDGECDGGSIWSVSLDGGKAKKVISERADNPVSSPDGRYIAYDSGWGCDPDTKFAIYNVSTGKTAIIVTPDESSSYFLRGASIVWSPDSKSIYGVVSDDSDTSGNPTFSMWKYDIGKTNQLAKAGQPTNIDATSGYLGPMISDNEMLFYDANDSSTPQNLFVINATTGEIQKTLVPLQAGSTRSYGSIVADSTGQHVLYVSAPIIEDTLRGDLRVSDYGPRKTVVLAKNISAAAW